ncbi:natural resistance-associated macrophage protein-domain-containing protein [Lipomyces tetrasporus]|uniref:Natural resistance-associated macrophage protein-domain-containing protein n=1 Tax=Lipomyces tetrasporus TaxID=54092 RepID=A0AAD7QV30_9ASCO|nr:natural resistance-associated macrophage protein-domain-containing protein [Lipomyces tetrasporus]KAJ8101541.1 natural resistance-associated macrophage protein-domain-containing protein [Lipomyces tetrasporus]
MNCPTRDPEPSGNEYFNQSPPVYDSELTTNRSSNTFANRASRKNPDLDLLSAGDGPTASSSSLPPPLGDVPLRGIGGESRRSAVSRSQRARSSSHDAHNPVPVPEYEMRPIDSSRPVKGAHVFDVAPVSSYSLSSGLGSRRVENGFLCSGFAAIPATYSSLFYKAKAMFMKYLRFVGPGFMIAVAYIDPGNYSTDVAAGAMFRFDLLFVVMLSNIFAIFLQSLCAKLGSVTGLDLAQMCRAHFPRWLCVLLYILAETAIIATDLAEVIGTAISLNILFKVPLVAGVAITIVDVLIVLVAYKPNGSLKGIRWFEYAVAVLVLAVVICFCVELGTIKGTSAGEVFRGFLPSKTVVSHEGLYYSCGILGATVMPHSLYLGSGLVQPRLREYDEKAGNFTSSPNDSLEDIKYRPSLDAIRHALQYSIVELALSLVTFALFVNSSILIVSGATLSDTPGAADADLFSIHDMLSSHLSPAAGTVFALALLFSGQSAGIVCTLAGQMVSEGFLHWTMRPWLRRLVTRAVAIVPCIVVAGAVGREGLAEVLNLSQVILSILLPFVSAPLIYFTCRRKYMRVPLLATPDTAADADDADDDFEPRREVGYADLSNNWLVTTTGVLIWLFISGLNVYLIVLLGMGEA